MQKVTSSNIFHILLIVGLLLIGGGVFLVSQQVYTVSQSVKKLEGRQITPTSTSEQPSNIKTERQLLTIHDADRRLLELIDMDNARNWNAHYDASKVVGEPLMLDSGRKLHVPYDASWGNSQYELDTFEVVNGEYIFGPMGVSELHGAYRDGMIRVREARSLDAALADPSYTTQDCSGTETFKPAKVKVGNTDAVRYEGEACEAAWVGYEIQFGNQNLILVTGPSGGEELLKFVLERM